jgi:hypothetical protein
MSVLLLYLLEITIRASINKMYTSTLDLEHQYGNTNDSSRILSYPEDAACVFSNKIRYKVVEL